MSEWNGWRVQGNALVRDTKEIPLAYFVTADHCIGYIDAFARAGADDACIAGLARAFVDLRRRK
jgi:hypothetical protein